MISLKQLNYALAVEKTLHFKKAAELCHISQSALSTALSEMEGQLGFLVFERDNKKVLVTPQGKELLERARTIMLEVDEITHLVDSQKSPLSFPLTVGIIPTIAPYLLPVLFPLLMETYPDAEISIVEEESANLVDLVRRGELDTAIIALPFPHTGLLALDFWEEDFFWICKKGCEHSEQKEITSKEISEGKLMLLKDGHCLKDHIVDVCKLSDSNKKSGLSATSLNTLVQMVQANLGTTLIPAMAIEQLVNGNSKLSAVHLKEPSPHRKLAFILRPNYTRLSSLEALSDLCKKSLKK